MLNIYNPSRGVGGLVVVWIYKLSKKIEKLGCNQNCFFTLVTVCFLCMPQVCAEDWYVLAPSVWWCGALPLTQKAASFRTETVLKYCISYDTLCLDCFWNASVTAHKESSCQIWWDFIAVSPFSWTILEVTCLLQQLHGLQLRRRVRNNVILSGLKQIRGKKCRTDIFVLSSRW